MKDYYHFKTSDFVMDKFFQHWVWCPDDEGNKFWRTWIEKHPDKNKEVEEAIEVLKGFRLSNQYALADEEIARLWGRIQNVDQKGVSIANEKTFRGYWKMAAAVSLLIGILSVVVLWNAESRISYQTPFGKTRKVVLPDSSIVTLNANSSISFFKNWEGNFTREVSLEGEAFFDVVHTKNNKPFFVNVGNGIVVKVLGTSFNVYHRGNTKVVLNTGKITLTYSKFRDGKEIMMKPGELVEVSQDRIVKFEVNPKIYSAWTEKKIILNQTFLREMIRMAKDNYGIDIEVASEQMLTQTVSGSMPIGDSASFVHQIAKAFQLKISTDHNKIILQE